MPRSSGANSHLRRVVFPFFISSWVASERDWLVGQDCTAYTLTNYLHLLDTTLFTLARSYRIPFFFQSDRGRFAQWGIGK